MLMLIKTVIVGIPALALYFVLLRVVAKRQGRNSVNQSSGEFEVFARSGRLKAVPCSRRRGIFSGALFSGIFLLGAPVMIWRYGLLRSAWLFAAPFICAFGASVVFDYSDDLLNGMVHVVARAVISVWLVAQDRALVVAQLRRKGWQSVGSCCAESASAALRVIKPSASPCVQPVPG